MLDLNYISYYEKINNRNKIHFIEGLIPRFINYYKSQIICSIAKLKGAKIGSNSYITLKLALKANNNLTIGNSSIIESHDLDLRDRIFIGNKVIINKGVKILRASHIVDSSFFETISNELIVEDFVWIATSAVVLPSCKIIKEGSVIGASSVLAYSIKEPKSIVFGNPAVFKRYRKENYINLIVESLQGRDLKQYLNSKKINIKQD
jgi:acetyltransferase-like isoleucine patch superfamily enzyme